MKNKFISKQSNEILTYFNEQEIHCFDYEQAKKALPYDYKSGTVFTFIRKTHAMTLCEDDNGKRVYVPNELVETIK